MSASRSTTLTLAFSSDVVRTAPTGQLHLVPAGASATARRTILSTGAGRRRDSGSTGDRVNADFWDQRHMS